MGHVNPRGLPPDGLEYHREHLFRTATLDSRAEGGNARISGGFGLEARKVSGAGIFSEAMTIGPHRGATS